MEFSDSPSDRSKRCGSSLVLTPQAGAFVSGVLVPADGTPGASPLSFLVKFPLERHELYAHTPSFQLIM